jgi:protein gp37
MQNSKIEWTHHTFNPWWGCVNVSPACDHCYAERFANRKTRTRQNLWGKDSVRFPASDRQWDDPVRWDRLAEKNGIRSRVFCGSMCDVMEKRNDLDPARERLFDLIEKTPNLDWLLLTKRPQEYRKQLPKEWLANPRHNVWLMTTCETEDYLWRIEEMMQAPAVVYGVSFEPLLGAIRLPDSFLKLGNKAWAITGGESGPGARPSRVEWFLGIRDQCLGAGVPFHFKQWGNHGSDLIRISKKQAGRVLDGREWDEFPLIA